jgi:hypothetical protein
MNHQNQLEQMANGAMFATESLFLGDQQKGTEGVHREKHLSISKASMSRT